MIEGILEWVYRYGPVGLFVIALVSNAIPYSTIPYLVIVAPILSVYSGRELLASVMALAFGAAIGKIVVYMVGRGLASIGRIGRALTGLRSLAKMHKHATFALVFVAAALPIPDDVFYIPVGISRYSITMFFVAVLLGKIVITYLAALYGRALRFLLEEVAGMPSTVQIPAMIAITLVIVLIGNSIDWEGVNATYENKGALKAISYMLTSIPSGLKKTLKRSFH